MELWVTQDGSGSFCTITEAVQAVPYHERAIIHIKPGIYKEKPFVEKREITLEGEDPLTTIITYADGARHRHTDTKNYGTFRSYTAFLGGEHIHVKNLTIANTAGDGRIAGQAIAAYVDAECAYFQNVRLLGHQDTLFTSPLPNEPHIPGSFIGPREYTPRHKTKQFYDSCYICGDIDFIFGGADAVFQNCEIFSLNRGEAVNGYIAAPCTPQDSMGYVFLNCRLTSDCAAQTVYLGRPWREHAKVNYINCEMGAHISAKGWDNWNNPQNENTASFSEYGSTGPGASANRAFGNQLSQTQASLLQKAAEKLQREVIIQPL